MKKFFSGLLIFLIIGVNSVFSNNLELSQDCPAPYQPGSCYDDPDYPYNRDGSLKDNNATEGPAIPSTDYSLIPQNILPLIPSTILTNPSYKPKTRFELDLLNGRINEPSKVTEYFSLSEEDRSNFGLEKEIQNSKEKNKKALSDLIITFDENFVGKDKQKIIKLNNENFTDLSELNYDKYYSGNNFIYNFTNKSGQTYFVNEGLSIYSDNGKVYSLNNYYSGIDRYIMDYGDYVFFFYGGSGESDYTSSKGFYLLDKENLRFLSVDLSLYFYTSDNVPIKLQDYHNGPHSKLKFLFYDNYLYVSIDEQKLVFLKINLDELDYRFFDKDKTHKIILHSDYVSTFNSSNSNDFDFNVFLNNYQNDNGEINFIYDEISSYTTPSGIARTNFINIPGLSIQRMDNNSKYRQNLLKFETNAYVRYLKNYMIVSNEGQLRTYIYNQNGEFEEYSKSGFYDNYFGLNLKYNNYSKEYHISYFAEDPDGFLDKIKSLFGNNYNFYTTVGDITNPQKLDVVKDYYYLGDYKGFYILLNRQKFDGDKIDNQDQFKKGNIALSKDVNGNFRLYYYKGNKLYRYNDVIFNSSDLDGFYFVDREGQRRDDNGGILSDFGSDNNPNNDAGGERGENGGYKTEKTEQELKQEADGLLNWAKEQTQNLLGSLKDLFLFFFVPFPDIKDTYEVTIPMLSFNQNNSINFKSYEAELPNFKDKNSIINLNIEDDTKNNLGKKFISFIFGVIYILIKVVLMFLFFVPFILYYFIVEKVTSFIFGGVGKPSEAPTTFLRYLSYGYYGIIFVSLLGFVSGLFIFFPIFQSGFDYLNNIFGYVLSNYLDYSFFQIFVNGFFTFLGVAIILHIGYITLRNF